MKWTHGWLPSFRSVSRVPPSSPSSRLWWEMSSRRTCLSSTAASQTFPTKSHHPSSSNYSCTDHFSGSHFHAYEFSSFLIKPTGHTFPVGEMQHRVAEFCYCFCLDKRTHSFHFPLVARKAKGVGRTLE